MLVTTHFAQADELNIDLRNPIYNDGVLYTNEGGVIQGDDLRIQAKTIQYFKKKENGKEIHKIEAEGDLLIQYKDRAYIGSELEYDFITKTGIVYEGKTQASMWYIGGDEIKLNADGSYNVKNVSITTCENKNSSWDLHARRVNVMKNNLLEAKKMRFRMFKIPLFWLPSFKVNLKKFREPIFRYTLNWDKGQGPRAGIRYQLYSWQDLALYGRVEYRWRTGWGGAFETEYFPEHKRTTFVTRSFCGTDRLQTAPNKMFRYRLQGALESTSENNKTKTVLTWDKYNDVRMPSVFKSDDFEVRTAGKSLFYVRHQEDRWIGSLKVRPRLNPFESIKQDLPTLYTNIHPEAIGNTGFYNFLSLKAGYVDFAYSDQLVTSLKDYRSGRFEIREKLHRPISIGPLTLTPFAGVEAIFYTNSPSHQQKNLATFNYGIDLFMQGRRTFDRYQHIIQPYASFHALTKPTVSPDDHYIFSIADGWDKINQVQAGVRNTLFSKRRPGKEPSFTADLYVNAFFSDPTIPQFIPKLYLNLCWKLPSVHWSIQNAWNFRHHEWDFSNTRVLWTLNENVAISLEARFRSQFDWRKADHESFILDVTRSESDLLLSPLSDRRICIISNLFIRLTPLWDVRISTLSGFYRINEKPYNEAKVDLSTWLSSSFKARLSYSHVRNDDRVSFHLDLVKKQ